MESPEVIREALAQHVCTEQHWLLLPECTDFKYTDGVKNMAEICEAYWLITAIFSWQQDDRLKNEPFQVWMLRFNDKTEGNDAVLFCEDGNDNDLIRQEMEYTDFPLPEGIMLFLDNGVLLLPSEY